MDRRDAHRGGTGGAPAGQRPAPMVVGKTAPRAEEVFVTASGKADGHRILPRDLYVRRLAPSGREAAWPDDGARRIVVVIPGFPESGGAWAALAEQLAAAGHDVMLADLQWAGFSEGSLYRIDRGLGVARDVAAIVAAANMVRRREYLEGADDDGADGTPDIPIVLVGGDLGASAGILSAVALNDHGRIALDGFSMPTGVRFVLSAPLFELSPNTANRLLATVGRLPLVGRAVPPADETPQPSEAALRRYRALRAAAPDIDRVLALIRGGEAPAGRGIILHAPDDPVASFEASRQLAVEMGVGVELRVVPLSSHRLHRHADGRRALLDAVAEV